MTRDHPRLFFDTRRILPSTPRRFFGSLEESKGARIKITPTVRDQLIRVLPTLEMNHYQKTIRTVQHKRKKSEIIKKTGRVSEEWITGELDSANSAESIFECIDPNHEHRFDIGNIEYYIPDYCFKKEQSLAIMSDKRIVAETIFYKGQFLASSDKNTIYHDSSLKPAKVNRDPALLGLAGLSDPTRPRHAHATHARPAPDLHTESSAVPGPGRQASCGPVPSFPRYAC